MVAIEETNTRKWQVTKTENYDLVPLDKLEHVCYIMIVAEAGFETDLTLQALDSLSGQVSPSARCSVRHSLGDYYACL